MEKDDTIRVFADHFSGVVGTKVGRPVGVELEFDVRAVFQIDIVFKFAVEAFEFPVVVMLEEFDAEGLQLLHHRVGGVGGAFDGVKIFEILGAIAADDAFESEFAGLVDGFVDIVEIAPRAVGGSDFETEIGSGLVEIRDGEVAEAAGFDADVADVGDGLEDAAHSELFDFVAEGVHLYGQFAFEHGWGSFVCECFCKEDIA